MENELRPVWSRIFNFNWKFGLFLVLVICIPRFILVLIANSTGNYGSIGLIMLISAVAPFLFLTKYGRKKIGLTRPRKYSGLVLALIAGLIVSFLLYYIGQSIYGNHYENWYNYIGRSYKIPTQINSHDKAILFAVVALTGMIFSPIGEELFFRGIVHASFANSIGEKKASIVDSSAFAVTHISHFGFVYINQQWHFLTTSTLIWVVSMFLVSVLFFVFKQYSGSILGAITCHAAFNLGMIYCIFYLL
ncbi:CPBP family intramembrane glutamic endopeptidase [Adhaeribacter radiodurans]|uniref:CPBP family intramembrane metalloprotease n=1 Tax=Adhaeribacter radiodurans TaxID=2745197 RepID=A0A7L7L261_9BACT|nr:type II CAAX endopeptidase family protein [Adhaeribacter radiodurans]QMU26874.1 CPBP family intramembrane metalloprotease [Adhaeribacter radiodurans]